MSHMWILTKEIHFPLTTFLTMLLTRWAKPRTSWARGNQNPLPASPGSGYKKYLVMVGINDVPWQ